MKERIARLVAALSLVGPAVLAQVAPAPRSTPGPNGADKPDTTVLSPFEVVADPMGTYEAVNFTSLTGSNKPLAKVPVTAEILTEQAIADLAVTNPMDALRDIATGVGAPYTQAGSATQAGAAGDNVIVGNFKLRGLAAGTPLRNGFMDVRQAVTPFEGLNMSRIEVIRGPQALIYGPGSPGGVLNIVTKKASFGSNRGSVELRADDNGSLRASLDGNFSKPLFGRRAAVRVAAVRDNANFWRRNLGQDTKGHYVEAAIELFKPSATTLRFEYEEMRVDRSFSTGATITAMPAVAPNNTLVRLLLAEGSPALSQVYNGGITWENVDSFGTTSAGRWDKHSYIGWTLSSKLTPWLQAQVQAGRDGQSVQRVGRDVYCRRS
jgi:outer membrane receptor protein involved in Fe transport